MVTRVLIPSVGVSSLVQAKALANGIRWMTSGNKVIFVPEMVAIFIDEIENKMSYRSNDSDVPPPDSFIDIPWQKYVYGEGYFFKAATNTATPLIYFQIESNNRIVYMNSYGQVKETAGGPWRYYAHSSSFVECDCNGAEPLPERSDCRFKEVI